MARSSSSSSSLFKRQSMNIICTYADLRVDAYAAIRQKIVAIRKVIDNLTSVKESFVYLFGCFEALN